jgi:putative redox protein
MADLMVTVKQVEDTPTSAGTARQHQVAIDRPKEKGGFDEGAMGCGLLLLSLGGCFMSNLIAAAKARDVASTT